MIRHLEHHEIDKAWWDQRLAACGNRTWYAQSWVLDIASPGWNAMVDDDSGAIMPLTWRSRLGLRYLHQPFGLQQLGVFAPNYTDAIGEVLLRAVPGHYRYWDIYLNEAMGAPTVGRAVPCTQQTMPVPADEAMRLAGYSTGHRRNLRKAEAFRDLITWEAGPKAFMHLFSATTSRRFGVPQRDLRMIAALIAETQARGQARLMTLGDAEGPQASICFVEHDGRAILLKTANSESGKDMHAMFLMIDAYLAEGAGGMALLDFAGSNYPAVQRFYAGFGARTTVYSRLLVDRLPRPLRWIKQWSDGA